AAHHPSDRPRSPWWRSRCRDSTDSRRQRRRGLWAGSTPTGRGWDPSSIPPRGGLVLNLVAQLFEVLAGDVHPVFFGREVGGERDVALPLGDRFPGIRSLVDDGEVVHRAGVLAVDLDDALVLLDRFLVEALVLVHFTEAHPGLDGRRIEVDGSLV